MLKQDGWCGFPSGREKIALELKLSRQEIEKRYGLKFIDGSDSLGRASSTYFNDDLLGPGAQFWDRLVRMWFAQDRA